MKSQCLMVYVFCLCTSVSVSAQVLPGTVTVIDTSAPVEVVTFSVTDQAITETSRLPLDTSVYYPAPGGRVHSATGDLLGIVGGMYDYHVARFRLNGGVYSIEPLFALRSSTIINRGNPVSMSFDDEGILYYKAGGGYLAIDLDAGTWVALPQVQPGTIISTVPAKAGRPRVDVIGNVTGPYFHCVSLAAIDPGGGVLQTFMQRCGSVLDVFAPGVLETTSSGRTFFVGGWPSPPGWPTCLCLREIDYATGAFNEFDFSFEFAVSTYVVAEGLGKIYCHGALAVRPWYGVGVVDLQTGETSYHVPWGGGPMVLFPPSSAWFPQNVLTVFPQNPMVGRSFTARLSIGGEVGDLGLILVESVTVNGQLITLNLPVAQGTMDGAGLVKTEFAYDPTLYPMAVGDSLTFRGYWWDGAKLWQAEPRTVTWR
ncbi:MAG: hypothetical protein H6834_14060 [Planctomycetes bacterium]|nr:hypothetical protein [Planctomycetota bacterium]